MMRILILTLLSVLLVGVGNGCGGKKKATSGPPPAYVPGGVQAQMHAQENSILVRGNVANSLIPWSEGLRLSEALVAADYLGRSDPFAIYIHRAGKTIQVSPRRILSGTQDPELQLGDIVEIRR